MDIPSFVPRLPARIRSGISRGVDAIGAVLLRLVRPWERLAVPAQIAIAFPTLSVVLFLFHLGPLNQPLIRAIFYGLFWSVLATPAVVLATRNELRKRDQRDAARTRDQG
jgi:hypothetical protein